jgi:hypothetical protein
MEGMELLPLKPPKYFKQKIVLCVSTSFLKVKFGNSFTVCLTGSKMYKLITFKIS